MDLDELIYGYRFDLEAARRIQDYYLVGIYTGRIEMLEAMKKHTYGNDKPADTDYPQSTEDNEYRYIDADWLDMVAAGLTAGVKNHPGETWQSIPAAEHAARAMRHLNLYRAGDESDDHLINASMRIMMSYVVDREE